MNEPAPHAAVVVPCPEQTGRPAGFTLVELLVVVAIISVLLSILLPAMEKSRRLAKTTVCLARLHVWGQALTAYEMTHNGYLPRRGQGWQPTSMLTRPDDWFNALPAEMGWKTFEERYNAGDPPRPGRNGGTGAAEIWNCPQAEDMPERPYVWTYAMNMGLSVWSTEKPDHMDRVGPPVTMVFLVDAPGPYCSAYPSPNPYSPLARHGSANGQDPRVNILFLDGHAMTYAGPAVGCDCPDPLNPEVRWEIESSTWMGPPH